MLDTVISAVRRKGGRGYPCCVEIGARYLIPESEGKDLLLPHVSRPDFVVNSPTSRYKSGGEKEE